MIIPLEIKAGKFNVIILYDITKDISKIELKVCNTKGTRTSLFHLISQHLFSVILVSPKI